MLKFNVNCKLTTKVAVIMYHTMISVLQTAVTIDLILHGRLLRY